VTFGPWKGAIIITDRGQDRKKVFGVGLNKTGSKTLATYLRRLGFRHRSYDSNTTTESPSYDLFAAGDIGGLLDIMEDFDSCEDWPWPMLYRELDERFPDARFVLTVRDSADRWYRSLCNMAVRIGPLPLYERSVYGHAMPHGHREEHIRIYEEHNEAVTRHFASRSDKLLRLCWDEGDDGATLARFLGHHDVDLETAWVNRSPSRVYDGDNRVIAEVNRWAYQLGYGPEGIPRRILRRIGRTTG
jgi:hypothetical protein